MLINLGLCQAHLSVRVVGLKQEGGELFMKDFRKY